MFLKNCGNAFHVNCGKVKQYIIAEMNKYVLKNCWNAMHLYYLQFLQVIQEITC